MATGKDLPWMIGVLKKKNKAREQKKKKILNTVMPKKNTF